MENQKRQRTDSMTAPTPEAIAKLPKWAQSHIASLSRELEGYRSGQFTTTEVAAMFKRSSYTINRWVQLGRIKPIRGTGGIGQYLFTQDEIERFKKQLKPAYAY